MGTISLSCVYCFLRLPFNEGPFPPPELPGFFGTTGLSDFPHGPACSSRSAGSGSHAPPLGDPVLRLVFLGLHAVVFTPADVLTPQRSPVTGLGSFRTGSLPRISGGSASAIIFSGPQ